jgi:hypothetical protein
MIRKLRGLLSTTLTICVPSTVLGALAGLAIQLGAVPGLRASGVVVPGAVVGALVGVIAGLTYSIILLTTERGKRLDQLRLGRFAVWGGLALAAPLGFLFHSPIVAVAGALLGAVVAPVSLAIARRATSEVPVLPESTPGAPRPM